MIDKLMQFSYIPVNPAGEGFWRVERFVKQTRCYIYFCSGTFSTVNM